jgi:hypothetical protein
VGCRNCGRPASNHPLRPTAPHQRPDPRGSLAPGGRPRSPRASTPEDGPAARGRFAWRPRRGPGGQLPQPPAPVGAGEPADRHGHAIDQRDGWVEVDLGQQVLVEAVLDGPQVAAWRRKVVRCRAGNQSAQWRRKTGPGRCRWRCRETRRRIRWSGPRCRPGWAQGRAGAGDGIDWRASRR